MKLINEVRRNHQRHALPSCGSQEASAILELDAMFNIMSDAHEWSEIELKEKKH